MPDAQGVGGEICRWHIARQSSPDGCAGMAEVAGLPKVGRAPHRSPAIRPTEMVGLIVGVTSALSGVIQLAVLHALKHGLADFGLLVSPHGSSQSIIDRVPIGLIH